MPVLDATFLMDLKRRPKATLPVLTRAREMDEPLIVPIQAAIEYAAGEVDVDAAFADIDRAFVIRPCDEDIAREAARRGRDAIKKRRFPGWADAQVAATAAREGMMVVTRNARDLDALGVRVWDYSKDEDPPGA